MTDAQRPAAWKFRDRCSCAAVAELYRVMGTSRIVQFAGAVDGARSPLFYLRRRRACGFAVHRRLVSANAPGCVHRSAGSSRSGDHPDRSARKWPEKIVLDTSQPMIAPPAVEGPPATQSVQLRPDEPGDQSNLQALAQLTPDTTPVAVDHPTLSTRLGLARTAPSKHVARSPGTRRPARAEAGGSCCQLGSIDNGQISSKAMSRTRAVSSWAMDWPALTGRN
jgi:hypothetical protein